MVDGSRIVQRFRAAHQGLFVRDQADHRAGLFRAAAYLCDDLRLFQAARLHPVFGRAAALLSGEVEIGRASLLTRRDALLRTAGLAAASLVPAAAVAKPVQGEEIDAALQAKIAAREIPGVVAMAANENAIIYQGAFGPRSMAAAVPMSSDTIFRIASMVKLLTSVAALQLVEQGKLKLDEPAANIDPTLAESLVLTGLDAKGVPQLRPTQKPITLRHLLSHTSGFSYPLWDPHVVHYNKAARGKPQ